MQRKDYKKKSLFSLCCDVVILLLEAAALAGIVVRREWSSLGRFGVIADLVLTVALIVWIVCLLSNIRDGIRIPGWVHIVKYVATCMVALAFFVPLAIIGPVTGDFAALFRENGALLHLVCPVLAMADFLVLERDVGIKPVYTACALIPVFLYGFVALILNLTGSWNGPYFFLKIHEQSVWMSIMWSALILGIGWALNAILLAANRCFTREYVY